jgi:hypothetical protein
LVAIGTMSTNTHNTTTMTYVNNDPPEVVRDIVDEFVELLITGTDEDVAEFFVSLIDEDEEEDGVDE